MKKGILLLLSFLTILTSFANNYETDIINANQMINIAGKQRMLSQKLAKIYLMKAYGANLPTMNTELQMSKIFFERNLETLMLNSDKLFSPNVRRALSKEKATWNVFKSILNNKINENQVSKVLEVSNQLLKDSHAVVQTIKGENIDATFGTNPELLDTIDKSGKQRMLSQRLCLYFVAKKFALKNKEKSFRNDTALHSTYNELDDALVNLLNSEVNTMTVEEAIGHTMITFENLRSQKSSFLDGNASLNVVYNTTNKLTKDFDNVTSKYSDLKLDAEGTISSRY